MKHIPSFIYKPILRLLPICCVDVCIFFNDQVLLIKRNTYPAAGTFWIPGGRLYKNYSLKKMACLKALQETNIDCDVYDLIHTSETIFDKIHSVNVCYLLKPKSKTFEIKLDKYSDEYKWIDIYKPIRIPLHSYVKECLRKVKEFV